jgi:ribosome biogenesis GTPase
MNLEQLGFDQWFKQQVPKKELADYPIARITAVNKNSYLVSDGTAEMLAELSGKFIFQADSSLDYPAVGDWVQVQFFNERSFAVIHEIIKRKSLLKRKTAGKQVAFQLIAANIDTAIIMQSLDANFNTRRLERYLAMINESHIHPVLLLSKSDLLNASEIEEKKAEVNKIIPDLRVITFSNKSESTLAAVKKLFLPGKTYCLLGSSGVGKSTLLNNLIGRDLFKIQAVREKDSRGRHTTARRQLIMLANGAMVIDTPGMRELGNMDIESGIEVTFSEITEFANQCRYKNCTHLLEEGCAVLAALKKGILSEERYQNYLKMKKESEFYSMSYLEKRKKDRQFGKFVKSVMKHKKNK